MSNGCISGRKLRLMVKYMLATNRKIRKPHVIAVPTGPSVGSGPDTLFAGAAAGGSMLSVLSASIHASDH